MKKYASILLLITLFFGLLVAGLCELAAETNSGPAVESVAPQIPVQAGTAIENILAKFPAAATAFFAFIGLCRFFAKPMMEAGHKYADWTDTPKDNEFLAKVESSKAWRVFLFVLDWLFSLKIRK